MELEEMKSAWKEMNKRIDKMEITNNKMIYKMIMERTISSFEKLIHYERRFFWLCLFLMVYFLMPNNQHIFGFIGIIGLELAMLYCVIDQWYKWQYLKKINLATDGVVEVREKILHYRLLTERRFKIGMYILVPVLILFILLSLWLQVDRDNYLVLATLIGAAVGLCIGGVIGVRIYRKHNADIDTMLNDLNDLQSYKE